MKFFCCAILFLSIGVASVAAPVTPELSTEAALALLERLDPNHEVTLGTCVDDGNALALVTTLLPTGYVVTALDDELPPVIAYSLEASFAGPEGNLLGDLIQADLLARLEHQSTLTREENRLAWQNIGNQRDPFQQWPPEGTTQTGGWLKTNWTQSAPYNTMCPMDNVTDLRSLAGCPAVAMAQIVNYHQTINGTTFSDADDYHHIYAGRIYWIDNDAAILDFPTWTELNGYLATMMTHYKYHQEQTPDDMAALVWACGAAMEQVYTSEGSGTFAVAQAFQGYQKFGFPEADLLTDAAGDFYQRMAQNIKDAEPVHLAVVTPAWDAGHNVVVDGYNTDNFFHLNFGWGGSYNGWYLLPSQIPYNLTVIEGAVLDIRPREYLFSVPDTLKWLSHADMMGSDDNLELINISDAPIVIEAINGFPQYFGEGSLSVGTYPVTLPHILQPGMSLLVSVGWIFVDGLPREVFSGSLEIVHQNGVHAVPMLMDPQFFYSGADDEIQTPAAELTAWPNPFSAELQIKSGADKPLMVSVYNLKGQRIKSMSGKGILVWDGTDEQGLRAPSGIYLLKGSGPDNAVLVKVMKIR